MSEQTIYMTLVNLRSCLAQWFYMLLWELHCLNTKNVGSGVSNKDFPISTICSINRSFIKRSIWGVQICYHQFMKLKCARLIVMLIKTIIIPMNIHSRNHFDPFGIMPGKFLSFQLCFPFAVYLRNDFKTRIGNLTYLRIGII